MLTNLTNQNGFVPHRSGAVWAPLGEDRVGALRQRTLDGLQQGQLDGAELRTLQATRDGLRTQVAGDRSTAGYVNLDERVQLHQQLNGLSQQLFGFLHN